MPRSAFSLWWYAVNRLRWRHVALSSSRVSPLRTCPALRPRGCSAYSPYRAPNCCLLSNEKHRLSLLYAPRLCVRTPTTSFSRLYHAASALVPSGSVQAIAALHAEFPTTLRARLWVGGLCTHWLTSMNFQEASFPIITGFLTRSFLDSVRQHMASPSKIEISGSAVSESAKKNHLRGKCNANFRLRSGRPGMNSGSATSSSLKRAPQQRASARLARVRLGMESPAKLASRRSLSSPSPFTTHEFSAPSYRYPGAAQGNLSRLLRSVQASSLLQQGRSSDQDRIHSGGG